jgi:hypothetical protein
MSPKLFAVWAVLDVAYLATGLLALTFAREFLLRCWRDGQARCCCAVVVRMQGGLGGPPTEMTLRRLVISDMDLNGVCRCSREDRH